MLRELKEGITKTEQLPEDGNIRKEIKRIKEVNNRLKRNNRGLPEDDLRDALLAMLPPTWEYWRMLVEREKSEMQGYEGKPLHSSEIETATLKQCLVLETTTRKNKHKSSKFPEEIVDLIDPIVAKKLNRCATCFSPHHSTETCYGTMKCALCGGPHSRDLHEHIKTSESNYMVKHTGDPNRKAHPPNGRKGGKGGKGKGSWSRGGPKTLHNEKVNVVAFEDNPALEDKEISDSDEEDDKEWHTWTQWVIIWVAVFFTILYLKFKKA